MKKKLNVLPDNPDSGEENGLKRGRFPKWLHRKLPEGNALWETQNVLSGQRLATVCEEAKCPNLLECWSKKTATFLAMGKTCTRNCGFCDIDFSKNPPTLQEDEPERIANSVELLGLKHVVITMVARDDLLDGGASHMAKIIEQIKKRTPEVTIEVLTSDFQGDEKSLSTIIEAKPHIFNHNIETVRSLSPRVRHKATYDRTLAVLRFVKQNSQNLFVKSGFMVGLGEADEEVQETLLDLREAGCEIVTIGQYLQPNFRKLLVKEFIPPEKFEAYSTFAKSIGIANIYSGPFVRSSYNAAFVFELVKKNVEQRT